MLSAEGQAGVRDEVALVIEAAVLPEMLGKVGRPEVAGRDERRRLARREIGARVVGNATGSPGQEQVAHALVLTS